MPTIILKTPNEEIEVALPRKALLQLIEAAKERDVTAEKLVLHALDWYISMWRNE